MSGLLDTYRHMTKSRQMILDTGIGLVLICLITVIYVTVMKPLDRQDQEDTATEVTDDISKPHLPTITIKEEDIIYQLQSMTLEALQDHLSSDQVTQVVLIDRVAFPTYYADVKELLDDMGIDYTEEKSNQ